MTARYSWPGAWPGAGISAFGGDSTARARSGMVEIYFGEFQKALEKLRPHT